MKVSPLMIFGQTNIAGNGYLDNPPTNRAGVVGSIDSLPLRLKLGECIEIHSQGIEGNKSPMSALFVYVGEKGGDPKDINRRSLPTVASGSGSAQYTGLKWRIEGPVDVNVRIMNASGESAVHGWYVQGEIYR